MTEENKFTKEDFLRLGGMEATKYSKEQLDSGKWTREQYLQMLKYWMVNNHRGYNKILGD